MIQMTAAGHFRLCRIAKAEIGEFRVEQLPAVDLFGCPAGNYAERCRVAGGDAHIHAAIGVTGAHKARPESIPVWQPGPEVVVPGHVTCMSARFGTQSRLETNRRLAMLTAERVYFPSYRKGFVAKGRARIAEHTRGCYYRCQKLYDPQHKSVLFDENLGHRAARDR